MRNLNTMINAGSCRGGWHFGVAGRIDMAIPLPARGRCTEMPRRRGEDALVTSSILHQRWDFGAQSPSGLQYISFGENALWGHSLHDLKWVVSTTVTRCSSLLPEAWKSGVSCPVHRYLLVATWALDRDGVLLTSIFRFSHIQVLLLISQFSTQNDFSNQSATRLAIKPPFPR